jgi:hypothetical protein
MLNNKRRPLKEKSMAEDGWYKRRLAELKAQAPVKREKVKPFVYRLDLSDAAKACTALGCDVDPLN